MRCDRELSGEISLFFPSCFWYSVVAMEACLKQKQMLCGTGEELKAMEVHSLLKVTDSLPKVTQLVPLFPTLPPAEQDSEN